MEPTTPQPAPQAPTPAPQVSKKSGLTSVNRILQAQSSQNLIDPVSVGSSEKRSQLWKSVILEASSVLFVGLFSYFFSGYLLGNYSLWPVSLFLLLWGAAEVMVGFIEENSSRRLVFIVLETAALLAFFHTYPFQVLGAMGLVTFVLLLWAYSSMRRELRDSVQIRFFTASGKVMGKLITVAVIFMVLMYSSLTDMNGNFFVSISAFNSFFNWTSGFVSDFYPGLPLTSSFGEFSQSLARMELQGNPQFQVLTPAQQSFALTQSSNDIMSSFASSTPPGIAITSSTPTSDAFYDYLSGFAQKLRTRSDVLFTSAWGVILFLILRSIGIIVTWIGQLFSLVFYEIFLAAGFMKIDEESTTREILKY